MQRQMVKTIGIGLGILLFSSCVSPRKEKGPELWYTTPAREWMQSLPVGNGRLGARVFGGVPREIIALNEATPFADLILDFDHQASPSGYRRSLDLRQALSTVTYTINDTVYTREVFCSNPEQVLVIRITSNKKKAISLDARMRMSREADMHIENQSFRLTGKVNDPRVGDGNVEFVSCIRFNTEGGKVIAGDSLLQIVKADEVTVLADIHTNLLTDHPADLCAEHITRASGKSYEGIRQAHTADFSRLFSRVELSLGMPKESIPTDERLEQVRNNVADPDLTALFFQYERYLLLSCSREDSLLSANQRITGITERLLQCHEGYIELLPSLPTAWGTGHFKGFCVREGAEVSASWTKGRVESASLTATAGNVFRLKQPERNRPYQLYLNGRRITEEADVNKLVSFRLKKGDILELK